MCRVLRCCQKLMCSAEQKKAGGSKKRNQFSQATMMTSLDASGKDREEVAEAAKEVYRFFLNESSHLKLLLSALSDGGMFFVGSVWSKVSSGYVHFAKEAPDQPQGVKLDDFIAIIQDRLCD